MPVLLGVFGLASLWNAAALVYGAVEVLGSGPTQWAAGAVMMALVLGLSLNSPLVLTERGTLGRVLKGLWAIALVINLGCTYVAHRELLVGGRPELNERGLILGLTALVCGAPAFFSLLLRRHRQGRATETAPPG